MNEETEISDDGQTVIRRMYEGVSFQILSLFINLGTFTIYWSKASITINGMYTDFTAYTVCACPLRMILHLLHVVVFVAVLNLSLLQRFLAKNLYGDK